MRYAAASSAAAPWSSFPTILLVYVTSAKHADVDPAALLTSHDLHVRDVGMPANGVQTPTIGTNGTGRDSGAARSRDCVLLPNGLSQVGRDARGEVVVRAVRLIFGARCSSR